VGLAVLLSLLVIGVLAVAFRPVAPTGQELDPHAASQALIDPAKAEPTPQAGSMVLPAPEILIEDDEEAEPVVADAGTQASESRNRAPDRAAAPGDDPPPARTDRNAGEVAPRAPAAREPERADRTTQDGRVVADEAPPGPGTELRPGSVVGDDGTRSRRAPPRRASDEFEVRAAERDRRNAQERQTPASESEPVAASGPSLRFLSARQQPLGVPLSLRVRPEGFRATGVTVYYQWRSEGSSGRRKRSLRSEGDGSFALSIPASELRVDRLQVWFIADPGGVGAGSASNPIEVKVR
jgi:hypothetical protein